MSFSGDTRTLVICPSTSTHIQATEEEKLAAGVSNDLIRVSDLLGSR